MCSEGVSVWFACKLCKSFFLNADDFAYHKRKSHFQEFHNAKFIVFEEQTTPTTSPPENWVSFLSPKEETRVHKIIALTSASPPTPTPPTIADVSHKTSQKIIRNRKEKSLDLEINKHFNNHAEDNNGSGYGCATLNFVSNSNLIDDPTTEANLNCSNLVEVVKTEFETDGNQDEGSEFLDEWHDDHDHDPFESESGDESLAEEASKVAESSSNNLSQIRARQTAGLRCNDFVDTGLEEEPSNLMIETNDFENLTNPIPVNSLQESKKRILELETMVEAVKGNVNKYKNQAKRFKLELQEMKGQHNKDVDVDIGFGVCVSKGVIEKMKVDSPSATIFARSLFRAVFSKDELKDRSLFGRACNANKDVQTKPAVDESKRNAVIAYTLAHFFKQDETMSISRQKEVKSVILGKLHKTLGEYIREVNNEKTMRID